MRCVGTAYCFSEVRVTNITPQGMRLRCAVTPCIGIVFCVIIRLCKNCFLISMAAQSTFICLLYPKEMFFHIFADIASRCGGTPILMFACSLWFYLFNGEDRDHRGEKKQNGGQDVERLFHVAFSLVFIHFAWFKRDLRCQPAHRRPDFPAAQCVSLEHRILLPSLSGLSVVLCALLTFPVVFSLSYLLFPVNRVSYRIPLFL